MLKSFPVNVWLVVRRSNHALFRGYFASGAVTYQVTWTNLRGMLGARRSKRKVLFTLTGRLPSLHLIFNIVSDIHCTFILVSMAACPDSKTFNLNSSYQSHHRVGDLSQFKCNAEYLNRWRDVRCRPLGSQIQGLICTNVSNSNSNAQFYWEATTWTLEFWGYKEVLVNKGEIGIKTNFFTKWIANSFFYHDKMNMKYFRLNRLKSATSQRWGVINVDFHFAVLWFQEPGATSPTKPQNPQHSVFVRCCVCSLVNK